jgi:hypothetical protein
MAMSNLTNLRTQGDVVIERLGAQPIPTAVKPYAKGFAKIHAAHGKACDGVDDAKQKLEAAHFVVAEQDALLDASLEPMVIEAVGAKLGTRQKPLAKFTRYSVSNLQMMASKKKAEAVLAMCGKVKNAGVPKSVAAASATCAKHATNVLAAITKLSKPQAAYRKALQQRDAIVPAWTRAYARLKKSAAAAWLDDEPTYKAVFEPAGSVQAPKKRRAKKAPAEGPAPT